MIIAAEDDTANDKDDRITTRRAVQNQQHMLPSRKRQSVINEIDVDRFMTEEFEGNQLFGFDFAEDNPAFRARKSKGRIMPDPNKC